VKKYIISVLAIFIAVFVSSCGGEDLGALDSVNNLNIPAHGSSLVFIEVGDAEIFNADFCGNIKKATGKVPRTGIPRITKVRDLKEDKQFTLCDPAGNTIYFGTPNDGGTVEARTLENEKHAKVFAVVYDLLHSHESPEKASKALASFMQYENELNDSDKEKLAKLTSEIEETLKINKNTEE
jgi:hypothetical protein